MYEDEYMKWTEEYKINTHDTDFNEVLSPTGYMRYFQDAAYCQMHGERPSYSELFHRGYAFVITRFNARFYGVIRSHEIIRCSTWSCESKGLSFNRCYEMYRGDEKIAEASSVWALLSVKDGRLCRNGEIEIEYSADEPVLTDMPLRLRIPSAAQFSPAGEFDVGYGDVDMNRHLNNTNYPDMFYGALPTETITGRRAAEISISFVHEAPMGEKLSLETAFLDGAYYMKSIKQNGEVNAEARFVLTDI
jgi:acyl-CoA thioesterase FadM